MPTRRRSTPDALANFDSSTTFLRALARYLRGEDFPNLGLAPRAVAPAVALGNHLPRRVRQSIYTRAGGNEGVSPDALADVNVETFRRWVVEQYPERGYPAIVIGSSSGAVIHLAALLGVPWLPQTFLVPVRRDCDPGAATADLEWGRSPGNALLDANPDVRLHRMHDPNQDHLLISRLGYFRVKSCRLGRAYERFLDTVLEPGGTIVVAECDLQWPTTRVDDRHVFQFGGVGGISPQEYLEGSDRVAAFLDRQGASRWNPPTPDEYRPEAEWGFEPSLRTDVTRVADERGYRVKRLGFEQPHDLSPLVADRYRDRYAERGIPADRLLVSSFALMEPWWTLRTGSVPYWMTFNTRPDARALDDYLDGVPEPYEEIYMMLFSNGIESAGIAPIDRWRSVLARARRRGAFVGVTPETYPADYGSYVRYHTDLPGTISARHPLLAPLSIDEFDAFASDPSREHPVRWTDG